MDTSKLLIIIGLVVLLAGITLYFFPHAFRWVGNLPGDIKIEKENSKFYFPITTMIVFSILLNIVLRLFKG